jgi:hypothetical protein
VHEATGDYIRRHWDKCTGYEKNYYRFVENVKKLRYEEAIRELEKNIMLDPRDLTSIHESAHFWLGINRPEEAAERYQPLFEEYKIFGERLHTNMYRNYFDALNRLDRQKEVIELSNRFTQEDYLRMGWDGRLQLALNLIITGPGRMLYTYLKISKSPRRF